MAKREVWFQRTAFYGYYPVHWKGLVLFISGMIGIGAVGLLPLSRDVAGIAYFTYLALFTVIVIFAIVRHGPHNA